jgi:hypothetical protein
MKIKALSPKSRVRRFAPVDVFRFAVLYFRPKKNSKASTYNYFVLFFIQPKVDVQGSF